MSACPLTLAASAVAARELGYRSVAQLVLDQKFSPARIVSLFHSSASRSARRDLAFVVLAGSVARYRARPFGWNGEPEATFARQLIGTDFDGVSNEAAQSVAKRWREIQTLAGGEAQAA
jgi:hypothetical protein